MRKVKKYFFFLIALLASCIVNAQKFTATASKTKVTVGETFQVDFTVNASGKNFVPPSFNDFTVYSGPNQSTSMQIINGSISQSITLSYYLAAKKEGTFTIGAASITAGGNTLQSNTLSIEAVKGSAQQQTQTQQGGNQNQTSAQASTENLFSKTFVSKTKVYAGEQITITHKVYTRMNLKGFQDVKFPSYNGFWAQEVPRSAQYEVTQENVDGVNYSVVEIKKAFLFAQRSGKIEIEPIEIQCVVREKTGKRNDPFEQFFGHDPFFGGGFDAYKDVLYTVKSNAVTIDVMPLPEANKPADFPGAVGNFSMNATLDKDKVKANEGINLKITISGKGNLKLIDAPKMNFPDEFETYDPKTNENISVTQNGVNGNKTFEYLIIPRHEGIYKIQPNSFTYFDAEKKNYIALPAKEFTITVEKGAGGSANNTPMISSVAKEDVKMIGSDIRYIKTGNINLIKKEEFFFGSPGFIAGFTVPPLLFLAFLFLRREHIRRNSDAVLVRKRRASGIAKKQLALAEKSMKNNDKENFFVNVLSALYNYVGNKMNISTSEQSKEKVIEVLKKKNISEETINELVKLMDECEFARYAPGLQSGNLQEVYNRAENSINKIEDSIS
ncbi:MAG: protein BatD [Bacteroidetes bacterium]|nr:protein BatD [Bacteroidota bacterium]